VHPQKWKTNPQVLQPKNKQAQMKLANVLGSAPMAPKPSETHP
jgi:hypothetical protein